MLEELYAPLPSIDAYLDRIDYSDDRTPTVATLDALIYAQLTHIPFEDLEVFEDAHEPNLAIEALFDKMITRKRGGYCFELNALFAALLRAMGFACDAVAVRGTVPDSNYPNMALHRGSVVEIDGVRRYCDVGFGGPSPAASVPLDGELYTTPTGDFRIVKEGKWYVIERVKGDEVIRTLTFEDHPCAECDFVAPNFYMANLEGKFFRAERMVNIVTDTGTIGIKDEMLRFHENGVLTEVELKSDAELRDALEKYFGIVK